MSTHIAKAEKSAGGLFEPVAGTTGHRVLCICGVTCEESQIVGYDPSCQWCARKLAERDEADEASRLDRIARTRQR